MPETTKKTFDFRGFHSVREYETECARLGHSTRRVLFCKSNEKYFALVTAPPGHPTGTSVEAWTLFSADETEIILDGIISGGMMDPAKYLRGGVDVNYLGKLAAHGYYPAIPDSSAAETAPPPVFPLEIVDDGTGFSQFSLLPM